MEGDPALAGNLVIWTGKTINRQRMIDVGHAASDTAWQADDNPV